MKRTLLWIAILVALVLLFMNASGSKATGFLGTPKAQAAAALTESDLFDHLQKNDAKVKKLVFEGGVVHVQLSDGENSDVTMSGDSDRGQLIELARKDGVAFDSKAPDTSGGFFGFLIGILPFLIPIVMIWLLFKFLSNNASAANRQMGFGKHKGQKFTPANGRVTFADVTGQVEAKQELAEVVQFLKDPSEFRKLGAKVPKGVLLIGPPGTGKTLLAAAVAGEANVPFFSISGSSFVEMFVGVGASRVRDLFTEAAAQAPAIIFIDEIDAVGRKRGGGGAGGGNDEREQTLNEMLVQMDGFDKTGANVVIIAATNRPDVLDPALLRPGRFTRQVTVDKPDFEGRKATFKLYLKGIPTSPKVDVDFFARATAGLSQADIASICNDAAILAGRRVSEAKARGEKIDGIVEPHDIDQAISRLTFGAERRSFAKVMTTKEKKNTSIHETAHAVAYWVKSGGRTLRKVTIIPTTKALGYVQTLPEQDQSNYTQEELHTQIVMALAGRVGQELILETIDTGALGDNGQAWQWARRMVAEFGMSKLGIIYAPSPEEGSFSMGPNIGPKLQDEIDDTVRDLMAACRKEAEEIVEKYKSAIEEISAYLMEKETILGPDFDAIMCKVAGHLCACTDTTEAAPSQDA